MSFIWFILIFLSMAVIIIYTNTEYVNEALVIGILISGVVLFAFGAIFITNFFIRLPGRRLKFFSYKSDFLVMNYKKNINIKGLSAGHIYGLIYDGENFKLMTYSVSTYDVAFIENVEYFEIVNRYSKNKNPNDLEYCLFERKNKY